MRPRHIIGLVITLVLCTSCAGLLRSKEQRDCAKAAKHTAKAAWLCPKLTQPGSAGDSIVVPGDSAAVSLRWNEADMDSLAEACADLLADRDQLAQALAAERDLYAAELMRRSAPSPRALKAVSDVRRSACSWTAFTRYKGDVMVLVRPDSTGAPLIEIIMPARTLPLDHPCPPNIRFEPKEQSFLNMVLEAIARVAAVCVFLFLLILVGRWAWRRFNHLIPFRTDRDA